MLETIRERWLLGNRNKVDFDGNLLLEKGEKQAHLAIMNTKNVRILSTDFIIRFFSIRMNYKIGSILNFFFSSRVIERFRSD